MLLGKHHLVLLEVLLLVGAHVRRYHSGLFHGDLAGWRLLHDL